jgi:predicted secreted acid phosphatase
MMIWSTAFRSGIALLRITLAAVALMLAALSAARAEIPAGCSADPQKFDWTQPGLDPNQLQLVYYRCTYYDADVAGVLQEARDWLAWRARSAHNPALVLDIDETSLSNWRVRYQNKFAYKADGPCNFSKGSICGENAWELSARAPAIAPTRDLFNAARREHVTVFFITGRSESAAERRATEKNLRLAGYSGWQRLYMRTKKFDGDKSVAPFKTWARGDIEARGYAIIANVGDQWSDLMNGHSEHIFNVPNPFYFIP